MDTKDTMNTILFSLTHYFNVCRMPELAIANILALMTMNYESTNRGRNVILNATFTYLMGYPFFLEGKPSHGVYMFMLGIICIVSTLSESFREIMDDWNNRFRQQNYQEVESVDFEEDSLDETQTEEMESEETQPEEIPSVEPNPPTNEESLAPPVEEEHPKTD
jgi:hypothetical protein